MVRTKIPTKTPKEAWCTGHEVHDFQNEKVPWQWVMKSMPVYSKKEAFELRAKSRTFLLRFRPIGVRSNYSSIQQYWWSGQVKVVAMCKDCKWKKYKVIIKDYENKDANP